MLAEEVQAPLDVEQGGLGIGEAALPPDVHQDLPAQPVEKLLAHQERVGQDADDTNVRVVARVGQGAGVAEQQVMRVPLQNVEGDACFPAAHREGAHPRNHGMNRCEIRV